MEHLQSIDQMLSTFLNLPPALQHAARENLKHSIDLLSTGDLDNEHVWERYIYIKHLYSNILKNGVAL